VDVFDGTTGDLIVEIGMGDNKAINDVLVTAKGVYCTDSLSDILYRIPLGRGGRILSTEAEAIKMSGFEIDRTGFNANGLVGSFDGNQLVIINIGTGVLYLVDTDTGVASPIAIEGAEQLFPYGDGLCADGRTLYICQNFLEKIAVVQLSGDLTQGRFVKNLMSNHFAVPTTIIGFGNSIYAVNTHFMELAGDPDEVQCDVVKVRR
jgi:hypothetical protein